jgi:hypothetical protein
MCVFFFLLDFGSFKSLHSSSCVQEREIRGRERKRRIIYSSTPRYVTPFWSHSSQLLHSQLLLVGKGVITQAPSTSNNTTTRNTNSNTTSKRKFKAEKNLLLSTLNNKEEFF